MILVDIPAGSAAFELGLKPNDVIRGINDTELQNLAAFSRSYQQQSGNVQLSSWR